MAAKSAGTSGPEACFALWVGGKLGCFEFDSGVATHWRPGRSAPLCCHLETRAAPDAGPWCDRPVSTVLLPLPLLLMLDPCRSARVSPFL